MVPPLYSLPLIRSWWFNRTASEFFLDGPPRAVAGLLPVADEILVVWSTAGEFFHDGSPGLFPACYLLLTRASWFNLTASEFFHDYSPSLLPVANESLVV
jgi:hypothetical protein